MEQNSTGSILVLIPYLLIGIIAGIINAVNAWIKLEEKYLYYIFFQPLTTFLFWGWLLIQIYVPAQIYWWILTGIFPKKPDINPIFIITVVIYGISFQSLLEYIEEQALAPRNLSIIVNWVDNLLEYYLKATQLAKASDFWKSLEEEMKEIKKENLLSGLEYLEDSYFDGKYNRLNKDQYQGFQNKLTEIKQENDISLQSKKLVKTLLKGKIPRRHLPNVLRQFKLSPKFINKYFKQS
ncbi:hypothetical protein [Crocosphaera watsonii]|uniref:Uncharacterized protein n=1 Tax=Crocosphaera watsonii WH 0401 TaxID=555881 RepID=T2JCS4_CROWT|nr:hypothetical protein [Crocosphaera watsonii]CCQ62941.1 hypothetical protein CWATWH0401_4719 [Crocosphaera watsonii WH 0401]